MIKIEGRCAVAGLRRQAQALALPGAILVSKLLVRRDGRISCALSFTVNPQIPYIDPYRVAQKNASQVTRPSMFMTSTMFELDPSGYQLHHRLNPPRLRQTRLWALYLNTLPLLFIPLFTDSPLQAFSCTLPLAITVDVHDRDLSCLRGPGCCFTSRAEISTPYLHRTLSREFSQCH